jgi:osmoprotectant transport system permease protein
MIAILEQTVRWILNNPETLTEQIVEHLNISLTAVAIGVVLWIPLGLYVYENERLANPVLGVAGMILTLPSLALLPLLIPIVGLGVAPALVALVLYSALPMVRNTYTGLESVDPAMVRSGRGLGMTDRQLLTKVKIPMALPVIFAGIRQAIVLVIGITTIAAYFGAGGLGTSIFAGIRLTAPAQIVGATIVVSVIAIVLDYGFYFIQRLLPGGKRGMNA